MASNKVNIKIGADVKEAKDGINKITEQLNKMSKANQKSSIRKASDAIASYGKSIQFVTNAIKTVNAELQKNAEAYKTQVTAEKQLETAAKNNPYLNSQSVAQLKNYASELQSISTMGDEQLLPFMAQLAAAGRTQTEIQDIMSAALDVSASGLMSFDSAVSALNGTMNGNIGTLGRQIGELKNLTTEELKSGKAIEIVKKNYAGMAEEVAKATGSKQQLQNAIGDFREELGAPFEKAMTPMRKFFTELISGWADAKKKKREYEEAVEQNDEGNGNTNTYTKELEEEQKQMNMFLQQVNETMALLEDEEALQQKILESRGYLTKAAIQTNLTAYQKRYEEHAAKVQELQEKLQAQIELEEKQAEEKRKRDEQETNDKKIQDEIAARDKLRAQYDETIEKAQREIEQRRKLGEEISEQEEAQLLLNTATSAYIQMMSNEAFKGNNGNYQHEVDARKQIEQWTERAKVGEDSDTYKNAQNLINSLEKQFSEELKMSEQIQTVISALTLEQQALQENGDEWQKYTEKINQLEELKTKVVEEETEKQKQKNKDATAELMADINDYVSQFADIMGGITDLMRENNETQTNEEMTELSKQYTDGLISYEEYCEKKKQIDKKAAQEEYKIKMWEWTTSLLQATANIAQGVSAALTGVPPASYIMAALTAASGAIQIATLMANKPKPPSFATGGVVGGMSGASMGGDNTYIHARQGEMILNAAQQAQLWKVANGGSGGGSVVNMPVTIENNANANVSTNFSQSGLKIVIDEIVNSSMASGTYTKSMEIAQSKSKGLNYF